jgi:hypothetical protein
MAAGTWVISKWAASRGWIIPPNDSNAFMENERTKYG